MLGRIEAYIYGSGTIGLRAATADLTVYEDSGASDTVTLPGPMLLSDALAAWQSALNASGLLSNTYHVAWDAATETVRLERDTGADDMRPAFGGALGRVWGYTTDPVAWGAEHTGDTPSLARIDGVRVGVGPMQPGDRVDLRQYRHGRSESLCFGNHDVIDVRALLPRASAYRLERGYCAAGRVRIWQDATLADPYSPAYPHGYLDGYVLAVTSSRIGSSEEWTAYTIRLGVPRA